MSEPTVPPSQETPPDRLSGAGDDRPLEDFLARRSELSRLYRESPTEAPAALDAAIIAAARAAVAPATVASRDTEAPGRRADSRAVRRWTVPLSLAASLVLGVGVLRQVQQDPAARAVIAADAADAADAKAAKAESARAAAADLQRHLPKVSTNPDAGPGATLPAESILEAAADAESAPTSAPDARESAMPKPAAEPATVSVRSDASPAIAPPPPPAAPPAPPPPPPSPAPPPPDVALPAPPSPVAPAASAPTAEVGAAGSDASSPASSVRKLPPLARPSAEPAERRADAIDRSAEVAAALAAKRQRADAAAKQVPDGNRSDAESARSRAASVAAGSANDPVTATGSRIGGQAARYRGLSFGYATEDDVLRRLGEPARIAEVSSDITLPDGRRAHRLFEYSGAVEPRGRLRLYFDKTSAALAHGQLVLSPPLTLANVAVGEGLRGDGVARAADAPACGSAPAPPSSPFYPQVRVFSEAGVQLLLTAPDRVVEIRYFDHCP